MVLFASFRDFVVSSCSICWNACNINYLYIHVYIFWLFTNAFIYYLLQNIIFIEFFFHLSWFDFVGLFLGWLMQFLLCGGFPRRFSFLYSIYSGQDHVYCNGEDLFSILNWWQYHIYSSWLIWLFFISLVIRTWNIMRWLSTTPLFSFISHILWTAILVWYCLRLINRCLLI